MKKLYLLILIVLSAGRLSFCQTQPKFNLTKDGVKPVVLNFDASFSANQIYTKTKEWITQNYKNPAEHIHIDKENSLIKIGGYKEKAWKIRANNFDYWYELQYTLTIEIKDGKCRVTFDTPDTKYKVWYNSDGSTIPKFKDAEAGFENTINEMLTSLYTYIKTPKKKPSSDDW